MINFLTKLNCKRSAWLAHIIFSTICQVATAEPFDCQKHLEDDSSRIIANDITAKIQAGESKYHIDHFYAFAKMEDLSLVSFAETNINQAFDAFKIIGNMPGMPMNMWSDDFFYTGIERSTLFKHKLETYGFKPITVFISDLVSLGPKAEFEIVYASPGLVVNIQGERHVMVLDPSLGPRPLTISEFQSKLQEKMESFGDYEVFFADWVNCLYAHYSCHVNEEISQLIEDSKNAISLATQEENFKIAKISLNYKGLFSEKDNAFASGLSNKLAHLKPIDDNLKSEEIFFQSGSSLP